MLLQQQLRQATPRSFHTARVRLKTPPSLTLPLASAPAKLKPARSRAVNVLQNITSYCALKRSLVRHMQHLAKQVVLVIFDGWGYREQKAGNAIALAKKPCFDELWEHSPHELLEASGTHVGLPKGEMG